MPIGGRHVLVAALVAIGALAVPLAAAAQPYRCGGRPPGVPASGLCHYECVRVQGPDPGPMRPPVTYWAWRQVCANPSWRGPPRGIVGNRARDVVVVPPGGQRSRAAIRRRGQERWLNPQPEPPRPALRYRRRTWLNPQPEPPMSPRPVPAFRRRAVVPR